MCDRTGAAYIAIDGSGVTGGVYVDDVRITTAPAARFEVDVAWIDGQALTVTPHVVTVDAATVPVDVPSCGVGDVR